MTAITVRGADGEAIAVTGFGMVSSLGIDAVSGCAAARAGISRPTPIEDVVAWDDAEAELVPVHGHAVRALTNGFSGVGRLARLGLAAWEDLDRGGASPTPARRQGLYLGTTNGYYVAQARGREAEASERALTIADEEEAYQASVSERLAPRLLALRRSPPPNVVKGTTGQQAAFAALVIDAITDLRAGVVDECVVGAVDSLIDPTVVGALRQLGLLKTPDNPAGVAPGEGAAFLRLTRSGSVALGQQAMAFVAHAAWDIEETHRFSDEGSHERALLRLLLDALPEAELSTLLFGTLNGDPVRAMEWGTALISLPPWIQRAEHVHPVASFGDVGAAAGAMHAVLALRTLARSRAAYSSALVWAAGDDGGKGTIWLRSDSGGPS